MSSSSDHDKKALEKSLNILHRRAARALIIERLSASFWKPFFVAVGIAGFFLIGLPPETGIYIRGATIVVLLTVFFYSLISGFKRFKKPAKEEVSRFIEDNSDLGGKPLSLLEDELANPAKELTARLWQSARQKAAQEVERARVPLPRPFLAKNDPYGLRFIGLLLLVSGIFIAGQNWNERLANAFNLPGLFPQNERNIIVALKPPDYTGWSDITIRGPGRVSESVEVPEGTVAHITAQSRLGGFSFFNATKSEKNILELKKLDRNHYGLEAEIGNNADSLGISQYGLTRFEIPLTILEDTPPEIKSLADARRKDNASDEETDSLPPVSKVLPDGALRFSLSLFDDYGVENIAMEMRLHDQVLDPPIGYPEEQSRSVMSPKGEAMTYEPVYNFTSNPWAGLPAIVTFTVKDHLGQTAMLGPIDVVLPEREFKHPVAQTIIEIRKKLAWNYRGDPSEVAADIDAVLNDPDAFQHDTIAFLALRVAASRLIYHYRFEEDGIDRQTTLSVLDLLWDAALRIEDGNLSIAARNLREAQQELENALSDESVSEEDLLPLTRDVQEYLREYLSELQKELQKRIEEDDGMSLIPPEALSEQIDPRMMDPFMEEMMDELLNNNRDSVQDMLSQLQQMLDMLNPSIAGRMPENMQNMQEGVDEMQQLIQNQKDLLAQTELQAQKLSERRQTLQNLGESLSPRPGLYEEWGIDTLPPPPSLERLESVTGPEIDTSAHAIEQEALRYVLGQIMVDVGIFFNQIPEELGLAEIEMRGSERRLSENQPDLSIPHQELAIEYLEKARENMQQQMAEEMQQMVGQGSQLPLLAIPRFGGQGQQLDPLGRPFQQRRGGQSGQDEDGENMYAPVEIPDEEERKRVDEIIELLRERSGELFRPEVELDYFRRLLKQF